MSEVERKLKPLLPSHINFAITYKCNANCHHCSISADSIENERKDEELNKEELFNVLKQIADMKIHFLALCGGEPLLHENIFEIIDFCKRNEIFVALATNGLVLNEELILKLKLHGLDSILISLDGYVLINTAFFLNNS